MLQTLHINRCEMQNSWQQYICEYIQVYYQNKTKYEYIYNNKVKMMKEQKKLNTIIECLQYVNISKMSKTEIISNSDEVDFLKWKTSSPNSSDSSIFFKKFKNLSSNKASSDDQKSGNSNIQNENLISNLFRNMFTQLKIQSVDQNNKKIFVPSLCKADDSSLQQKKSLECGFADIRNLGYMRSSAKKEYNKSILQISPSLSSNNSKSKRRVKDINWPIQLQPPQVKTQYNISSLQYRK